MADDISEIGFDAASHSGRARNRLTRRLADIVCLPESRVTPQERWMTADILDELLRSAEIELRAKVANRLAKQASAPRSLLLRLAADSFDVAEPILRWSQALSDFDMMGLIAKVEPNHQITLARREKISETVAAALAQTGNADVIRTLLRNDDAKMSAQTVDYLVRKGLENEAIARRLVARPEMRPRQAFTLFWAVDHDLRRFVLERFSASRIILQDAAEDVFPLVGEDGGHDEAVDDALAYIDRRQRNRELNYKSRFGNLEGVVDHAFAHGLSAELRDEIASIANIQRDLLDRIMDDLGGEPIAVFAKAAGLERSFFEKLIACEEKTDDGRRLEKGEIIFNLISVDKAQTVLRYWNWLIARSAY